MVTFAYILIGILALGLATFFAALREMFMDLRQIRDAMGILDRPIDVDFPEMGSDLISTLGFPVAIDQSPYALVLFLSNRCATCRVIGQWFGGELPEDVFLFLESSHTTVATEFLSQIGFELGVSERVYYDEAGKLANAINLKATPVGYVVNSGRIARASTVPSIRYMRSILPGKQEARNALTRLDSISTNSGVNKNGKEKKEPIRIP